MRTVEVEKVIVGTTGGVWFVNPINVRVQVRTVMLLYAKTKTTCRAAGVLLQP